MVSLLLECCLFVVTQFGGRDCLLDSLGSSLSELVLDVLLLAFLAWVSESPAVLDLVSLVVFETAFVETASVMSLGDSLRSHSVSKEEKRTWTWRRISWRAISEGK